MRTLALLFAALLAPAASAQVTFTGVIEKATLPSICQEETHFIACTGTTPDSPTGVLLKGRAEVQRRSLQLDPSQRTNLQL